MANMGLDFRVPKRTAKEAWKVIEILYDEGYAFHGCGCDAGGYIPPTKLKDVPAFKIKHRRYTPGEQLLQKIDKKT
ncbi:MAG: hypothetical protein GY852_07545 [bacterium]|nr:hypothetical protein [bacterium]